MAPDRVNMDITTVIDSKAGMANTVSLQKAVVMVTDYDLARSKTEGWIPNQGVTYLPWKMKNKITK